MQRAADLLQYLDDREQVPALLLQRVHAMLQPLDFILRGDAHALHPGCRVGVRI
jgi:hypothetical protein